MEEADDQGNESDDSSQPKSPWLKEGWFRNHFDGKLYRTKGELHRGPEREGGWSDRNLALMLLDYVNLGETSEEAINDQSSSRANKLHKANTRPDLLKLAAEWDVPYMSQWEWERSIDTDQNWFQVQPISREFITPYSTKKIYVVATLGDIPYLSGNYKQPGKFHSSILSGENKFLEGRWDWEVSPHLHADIFRGHSIQTDSVLKIRPRIAPSGVHMYYCEKINEGFGDSSRGNDSLNSAIALEILPSNRLIEVRQLIKIIENVWNLRRHDFELLVNSNVSTQLNQVVGQKDKNTQEEEVVGLSHKNQPPTEKDADSSGSTWQCLSPGDKFVDIETALLSQFVQNEQESDRRENFDDNAIHLKLVSRIWPAHQKTNSEVLSEERDIQEESDQHSMELFLLQFQFNVNTPYEKRIVTRIVYKELVEGAAHQVIVAAEVENVYQLLNQPKKITFEYMYALIDQRSGNVMNSFTEVRQQEVRCHDLYAGEHASARSLASETASDLREEKGGEGSFQNSVIVCNDGFENDVNAKGKPLLPYHVARDELIYSR